MPLRHPLPFPPTHPPQILLAGSSTYVGGTVLATLLNNPSPLLENAVITCLVRSNECATTLLRAYGEDVNLIVRESLENTEIATEIASKHDVVINCAPASHAPAAMALMEGLAMRKKKTGRDVWMVHASGTENLADLPVSKKWVHLGSVREFDDAKDDVYAFEAKREAERPLRQRTTELMVINKGLELGIKTIVVMNARVYGQGLGLFERCSHQIVSLAKVAVARGASIMVGNGHGVWDHVHVQDLGNLYKILVVEILRDGGKRLPHGKKGIIFGGNGRHIWREVAQEVANVCYDEGAIGHNNIISVGLTEGLKLFGSHLPEIEKQEDALEVLYCSNSKTVPSLAKSLGWDPMWTADTWLYALREDIRAVIPKKPSLELQNGVEAEREFCRSPHTW